MQVVPSNCLAPEDVIGGSSKTTLGEEFEDQRLVKWSIRFLARRSPTDCSGT